MRRLRIIYFSRDYTTHDHRFLTALANCEHEVHYLRLEQRGHLSENRSLPAQIKPINWEGGRRPAKLSDSPKLLSHIKRIIGRIRPDIIQAGPLQTTALLVALAKYRPLVSMSWGYDLLIDADRDFLYRWATRYTLRHSAAMVGDCETIRQTAIAYGMSADRIVTFPWGIDLDLFSPGIEIKGINHHRSTFNLLSTRGWEPIYGVDILARAFARAARVRPELRLTMLSDGSLATHIRQIFLQAGVLERVNFPGQVSQDDLPHYYRLADLYISASHSDGTSISLLEAMACGLPALISDIPGNREWITPGVNGWLFPDGDADALGDAILNALDQQDSLQEMGQAARTIAEQRANWMENFPRLFQAYEIALTASV